MSEKISVIIPTKNNGDILEKCLSSIEQTLEKFDQNASHLYYPKDEIEVIIVDGHSTDSTVEIAKKYGCKIVYENLGIIGGARNIGVEDSKGKYIVFADADCVVPKDWIKYLSKKRKDINNAIIIYKGGIAMKEYIFHGVIEKEGDVYCALCLELDIATESDTLEGAKKNLREAVEGYIESVMKDGEEDEFIPRPAPEGVIKEYELRFKKYLSSFSPVELYGYSEVLHAKISQAVE